MEGLGANSIAGGHWEKGLQLITKARACLSGLFLERFFSWGIQR